MANLYEAQIGDKKLKVDIYDLPYSEFNAEKPLVIHGAVVVTQQSKMPNFTYVKIVGSFDISKLKRPIVMPLSVEGRFICRSNSTLFGQDLRFPNGITEIDCTGSLKTLLFLNGRIPSTVKKVIVSDSLFTNIRSDFSALAEAKFLQQRYKNVVFVGATRKKTLEEILEIKPSGQKLEIDPEYLKNPFALPGVEYTYKTEKSEEEPSEKIEQVADKVQEIADTGAKVIEEPEPQLETPAEKDVEVILLDKQPAKIPEDAKVIIVSEEEQPVKSNKSKYPAQAENELNLQDILILIKSNPVIQSFGVSDAELENEIRKHMKSLDRQIRFNAVLNTNITCILTSKTPILLERVIKALEKAAIKKAKAEARKKTSKKASEPKKQKAPKQPSPAIQTTKSNKHDIAMPVVIKKYIPKTLWRNICIECGKDLKMQQSVLESIAAINTELTETPSNTHVHIIDPKTGVRSASSFIKRERFNSIVQSINNSLQDDRRIVWAYLPDAKIFVCTGVFHEHTKTKRKNDYSKVRDFASDGKDANGKIITPESITSDKYFDVDFLLEQYKTINKALAEDEAKETALSSGKVIEEQEPTKTSLEPELFDSEPKIEEATRSGTTTPVLEHKTDEPVAQTEEKAEDITKGIDVPVEQIPGLHIDVPHNLVDVRAAEIQINAFIDSLTKTINQDLIAITYEQDLAKQIEQVDLVRDAMLQKAKIQSLLSEVGKTTGIMAQIQAYISSNSK